MDPFGRRTDAESIRGGRICVPVWFFFPIPRSPFLLTAFPFLQEYGRPEESTKVQLSPDKLSNRMIGSQPRFSLHAVSPEYSVFRGGCLSGSEQTNVHDS